MNINLNFKKNNREEHVTASHGSGLYLKNISKKKSVRGQSMYAGQLLYTQHHPSPPILSLTAVNAPFSLLHTHLES